MRVEQGVVNGVAVALEAQRDDADRDATKRDGDEHRSLARVSCSLIASRTMLS
jgi:hypothetical protein